MSISKECNECIRDKNWNRITITSKHNKDCKQYSNYDDLVEKQRKYAATLSEMDKSLKIHSWPRPIDARCSKCGEQFWASHGHHCEKIIGFPMEIV